MSWEYDPMDRTSGAPDAIWEAGQIIARVVDVGGPTRDNGRLMAAASALRAALADMLAGWRYLRMHHGDLYGVDWERAERAAEAAIAHSNGDEPANHASFPTES